MKKRIQHTARAFIVLFSFLTVFGTMVVSASTRADLTDHYYSKISLFDGKQDAANWQTLWMPTTGDPVTVTEDGSVDLPVNALWNHYTIALDIENLKALFSNPDYLSNPKNENLGPHDGEVYLACKLQYLAPTDYPDSPAGKQKQMWIRLDGIYKNCTQTPAHTEFTNQGGLFLHQHDKTQKMDEWKHTFDNETMETWTYDGGSKAWPTLNINSKCPFCDGTGTLTGAQIRFDFDAENFIAFSNDELLTDESSDNKLLPPEKRGKIRLSNLEFGRRIRPNQNDADEHLAVIQDVKIAKNEDNSYTLSAKVFDFMENASVSMPK